MPEREPRRFASDVMVYTKNKTDQGACIEVNSHSLLPEWKSTNELRRDER